MRGFVGIDRTALGDAVLQRRHSGIFSLGYEREGFALPLAHDNHDAALAALIAGEATITAVLFPVSRFDVATDVAAINFHVARNRVALVGRHDGFTDFVRQDERGFVLAIEIAAQLKGAVSL